VLEHLIVATPSARDVEAERALTELETRTATIYAGWASPPADAAALAQ
jgi:hypothetical protein